MPGAGQYAGIKYPIILGSDGAGIVAEAGQRHGKGMGWQGSDY